MKEKNWTVTIFSTVVLLGCASRDCAQLDTAIAALSISKIEVVNDELQTTNALQATPELVRQFSKTNRIGVSRYKKRYAPGYIMFHGNGTRILLYYYGDRVFDVNDCLFQLNTTNAITAQFQ